MKEIVEVMNEQEFELKYKLYAQLLYNIAYSYTRSKDLSDDIIQDTFMKYLNNPKIHNSSYEKYWLIRVCINLSIDNYRKNKLIIYNNDFVTYLKDDGKKDYSYINYLVSLLPTKYKNVIILYYYDELKIEEISEILKITASAVKMRLLRAREMLKKMEEKND